MKKGFFTFTSFAIAALVWGTMSSASDSVLEPSAASMRAEAQPAVAESAAPAVAQAEAETPEMVYYDDISNQFKLGGYIYSTWYDGFYHMNGDHNLAVNQTVLFAERQLDTARNGFDWGYNVTALFGTEHAQFADDGFDGNWGTSGDGYGMSIYECYAALGYENMSMKIGKFASPIGYESAVGPARDLNSTSYIHQHLPGVHAGALLNWDYTERLALNFGVVRGVNNSFDDGGNYGFIMGAKYQWTDRLAVSYEGFIGHVENDDYDNGTQYLHSVVATWDINCRLQYVFETAYGTIGQDGNNEDFFGISNYLKYQLTDNMQAIARFEWAEENGDNDYTELTLGVKYNINEHLMIRPEIRYDWVDEGGSKDSGFSGGIGGAFLF